MRSAGILAAAMGVLVTAATAQGPALAQDPYMPAPVSSAQMKAAQAGPGAPKPAAAKKTAAKPAAQQSATTQTATASPAAPHAAAPARSGGAQVFLLKGLAGVFSSGLDKLELKLQARGIRGQVASHASSDTLADQAIARYRAGQHGPIIIAGHSLGADAAVIMSQRLNDAKVPVALVITFAPVGYPRVMGNVSRAINYYQVNSAWHGQIVRGPGFKGSLSNIDLENAVDINHFNIDKADRIQAAAVNAIAAAIGGGGGRKAPAAPASNASTAAAGAATEQKPASDSAAASSPAPASQN